MEYTKIDNVFNYLPVTIRREQNDDDQIRSWVLQGWRNVATPLRYVKRIILLNVEDHKTALPEGIHKIINVRRMNVPSAEHVESLYECSCEPVVQTTGFDTPCSTYYRMFVFSKFYTESFGTMRYVGNWDDSFICKGGHTVLCGDTYSLTSDRNMIQTSFQDGVVSIEYFSEMIDSNEDFLIPKKPEILWQYLSAYVKSRHWENRLSTKEEGTMGLYQNYINMENNLLREVRGYFNGKAIRFNSLQGIIYAESEIVRIPQFLLEQFNNTYSWRA